MRDTRLIAVITGAALLGLTVALVTPTFGAAETKVLYAGGPLAGQVVDRPGPWGSGTASLAEGGQWVTIKTQGYYQGGRFDMSQGVSLDELSQTPDNSYLVFEMRIEPRAGDPPPVALPVTSDGTPMTDIPATVGTNRRMTVSMGAGPMMGGAGPMMGGAGPMMGGAGPMMGGAGPMMGGGGPMMGGAGPMMGGGGPMMGGAGPMMGGAGPMMGGAGPMMGGAGPMMGGGGPMMGGGGPMMGGGGPMMPQGGAMGMGGMAGMPGVQAVKPKTRVTKLRVVIVTDKGTYGAEEIDAYGFPVSEAPEDTGWGRIYVPLSAFQDASGPAVPRGELKRLLICGNGEDTLSVRRVSLFREDPADVIQPKAPADETVGAGEQIDLTAKLEGSQRLAKVYWDFDRADGITVQAVGETGSAQFMAAGTYTVTVMAEPASGSAAPRKSTLHITVEQPQMPMGMGGGMMGGGGPMMPMGGGMMRGGMGGGGMTTGVPGAG